MRILDPIKLASLAFAVSLIALWQVLADLQLVSPIFFPSPMRAVSVLVSRIADGSIWVSLGATAARMAIGWMLASAVGVILGAAIGSSRLARDLLAPTLEFVRPLPASAVIPVAILFLGLTNAMSLTVIAFGAIWPVLLASIHGFASVQRELKDVAHVLGFGKREFMMKMALPSALPDIMAGLRVSLAISLILTVVTEMQSSLPGLGWDIFSAQRSYRSADLYAGLIMLGALGLTVNYFILLVERRALRWRHLQT